MYSTNCMAAYDREQLVNESFHKAGVIVCYFCSVKVSYLS